MFESAKRRIGLFGGSFDPIHCGHLIIAQDAVEQLELDRLIFIPAARSPLKGDQTPVDGQHRLAMLRQAVEDNPRFEVSDIEVSRGGISFTIDTVRQMRGQYPDADLFFIVGADSLTELHLWRDVDQFLEQCTLVPFARGGEDTSAIAQAMKLSDPWRSRLLKRLIRIHDVAVSSSEIRMRVAEGLSIRYLVPSEAVRYIAEHGLYG